MLILIFIVGVFNIGDLFNFEDWYLWVDDILVEYVNENEIEMWYIYLYIVIGLFCNYRNREGWFLKFF